LAENGNSSGSGDGRPSRRAILKGLGIGSAVLVGGGIAAGEFFRRSPPNENNALTTTLARSSDEASSTDSTDATSVSSSSSASVTPPSSPAGVLPCDFLIYQLNDVYYAHPSYELGFSPISNGTPDIWALLDSVDNLTPLSYTSIIIKNGSYSGSATFNIGAAGKGYRISGAGCVN
jgi:hypothetical protein